MKKLIAMTATAVVLSGVAHAASVDLTGWKENGFQGQNGAGTWTVQPGGDSVFQSINGRPTVFFDPSANDQGTELGGKITVQTTGDNDYVGFLLGYQDGEMNSTNADFWLIDWKQTDQAFFGSAGTGGDAGLRLSHVTGNMSTAPESDYWNHVNTVSLKQTAATLGSTGWVDLEDYEFELTFTSSLIEVKVDGTTELSFTQADNGGVAFTDGAFGFYNYSQTNVLYEGITQDTVPPVPLPAGLPLLLAGLGAFGLMRRRQV